MLFRDYDFVAVHLFPDYNQVVQNVCIRMSSQVESAVSHGTTVYGQSDASVRLDIHRDGKYPDTPVEHNIMCMCM